MKSFKELSRSQKILVISAGLLAGAFFVYDEQEDTFMPEDGYSEQFLSNQGDTPTSPMETSYATVEKPASGGGKVVLYDKGLQMPMGTYILPQGWELTQDIATNPSTNQSIRYHVNIAGPQGELIRTLGNSQYGSTVGISFEQSWRQLVNAGLGKELEQLSFGNFTSDPQAHQISMKLKVAQRMVGQGFQVQCMKAPVSGSRNGEKYEGFVQITRMMPANNPEMYGSVSATFTIAPAGKSGPLMQTKYRLDDSFEINSAYEQRREQLQQAILQQQNNFHNQQMANSRATHQQRMANNQAAFDAHQQRMNEMSQMQDANHQSWMNNFRSSGSYISSGNNDYSGHDAFIDQIYERSTFADPYTGYNQHLDGQYDYNYTNGLGDYYRTNDPSFDPHSLQGDWQQIDPQSPNY